MTAHVLVTASSELGTRKLFKKPGSGYGKPTGHQFYNFQRFSKNLTQVGRVSPTIVKSNYLTTENVLAIRTRTSKTSFELPVQS